MCQVGADPSLTLCARAGSGWSFVRPGMYIGTCTVPGLWVLMIQAGEDLSLMAQMAFFQPPVPKSLISNPSKLITHMEITLDLVTLISFLIEMWVNL